MATDYPMDFNSEVSERSASIIQIDASKHVAVIAICAVLCGASAVYAWRASEKADRAEERADLLQYYLLELDAKVIASGVKKPEEAISKKLADKGE